MISCSFHLFMGISPRDSMTIPSIGPFQGLDLPEVRKIWGANMSVNKKVQESSHFTSRWTTGWAWRKLKADNRCTWQQLNSLYSYSSSSLMFFVTLAVVLIRQLLVTSKFTWWFRGSTDSHGTWTRAATCSESPPSFEWEAMRSNKSPPLQHSMTRDTTSSSWKTYTLKGRGNPPVK